ncbi:hypothetical protein GCM10009865_39470 [Aeromicrobium ponti]
MFDLFDKRQIRQLLEQANFQIEKELTVYATYLQDAQWEKYYANCIRHEFVNTSAMLQTLINSYYELMNSSTEMSNH